MIYFPYLPPGADVTADLELCFDRRGRYQESSFGVATRFPFAFLTKTKDVPLESEILIYPPIEPPDELFEILPLVRGEWESFVRGRGSDLYRIREYMPEDSARHVDWKATAKSGSLKVREFSREDERKLCIVFDNPAAEEISGPAYEQAVNLAASLAWHFSSHDAEVSFMVPGHGRLNDLHAIPGATGRDQAPEKDADYNGSASSFTARSPANRCAPTNRLRRHRRIQHRSHRAAPRKFAHGLMELFLTSSFW